MQLNRVVVVAVWLALGVPSVLAAEGPVPAPAPAQAPAPALDPRIATPALEMMRAMVALRDAQIVVLQERVQQLEGEVKAKAPPSKE